MRRWRFGFLCMLVTGLFALGALGVAHAAGPVKGTRGAPVVGEVATGSCRAPSPFSLLAFDSSVWSASKET